MKTDAPAAPDLKQLALGDLDQELSVTRRVLERVPEAHFAWKPHERSMSLGQLASHIAGLIGWQPGLLTEDGFDLATLPNEPPMVPFSTAELLATFDANAATLRGALKDATESVLGEPWTLHRGEHVILRMPRAQALRGSGISHVIHHRAQLSVYLRLLDVPVPAIYGPSADEGAGF